MLTQDETVIQISTCSRKLSIKAVLMEMKLQRSGIFRLGIIYSVMQLNIRVLACS